MSPLFIYLVKASATVFILWAFYSLCLRRMTFHRLNRYFFLIGIFVSLLWPALPLTEWLNNSPQVNQVVVYIPVTAFMLQFKPQTPAFGMEMAFKLAYFAGMLFMVVRLTIQILSLLAIFKKSEIQVINNITVRVVKEKFNPFSFFGYIFLNPSNHTVAELSAIILHEKIHETRTHSVDILLSEILKILLWFNPFSWLFCRAVKENIEFEVDRVLLHQGIDCKEYQYSLLQLSVIKNQNPITNHFNLSNLKTRIIMMNKNQSSRYGLAAYALVIPLILLCMVFSYAFAQEKAVQADSTKQVIILKQKVGNIPDKALIILDGKIIDKAKMDAINPNAIYSMNVLKGENATSIYGRKGKNGVILITLKKENEGNKYTFNYHITDSTGMNKKPQPLYILNGVPAEDDVLKNLKPDLIEHIDVLKNESATSLYGEKGKNGVILITTKNSKTIKSGDGNNVSYITSTQTSDDGNGAITITTEGKKQVTDINKEDNSVIKLDAFGAYYLLDGKEIDETNKYVNAKDIEKMEVLKGEAATSLYGKKAAKGVILITTKKK